MIRTLVFLHLPDSFTCLDMPLMSETSFNPSPTLISCLRIMVCCSVIGNHWMALSTLDADWATDCQKRKLVAAIC